MIVENLGRVMMVPQGTYSAGKTYQYLDVVFDSASGSSYLYKAQTPASGISLGNESYWQIFGDVRAAVGTVRETLDELNSSVSLLDRNFYVKDESGNVVQGQDGQPLSYLDVINGESVTAMDMINGEVIA